MLSSAAYAGGGDGPKDSEDPTQLTLGASVMKNGNLKGSPDYMPGGSFEINGPVGVFHVEGNANGEKTDYKIELTLNAAKENMFGVFPANTFMRVVALNSNDEEVPISMVMASIGFKAEEKLRYNKTGKAEEFVEGSLVQGFVFAPGSGLNNARNFSGAELKFLKNLWGTLPFEVRTIWGLAYGSDKNPSSMFQKTELELDVKLANQLHIKPSASLTSLDGQMDPGLKLKATYDLNFGSSDTKKVTAR